MLAYVFTKGRIGGGHDGGGDIGTIELPDALTWMIHELRLCKKYRSTTGFPSFYSLLPAGGKSNCLHHSQIFIS